jgi:hypothetical protein
MLRRYLISNAAMTGLLYGTAYSALPASMHYVRAAYEAFDSYVMQSPLLGPILNKVIVLTSSF